MTSVPTIHAQVPVQAAGSCAAANGVHDCGTAAGRPKGVAYWRAHPSWRLGNGCIWCRVAHATANKIATCACIPCCPKCAGDFIGLDLLQLATMLAMACYRGLRANAGQTLSEAAVNERVAPVWSCVQEIEDSRHTAGQKVTHCHLVSLHLLSRICGCGFFTSSHCMGPHIHTAVLPLQCWVELSQ